VVYETFGNFYPKGSAVCGNADLVDYNFGLASALTSFLHSGLRLRVGGIELRRLPLLPQIRRQFLRERELHGQ